MSEIYLKETARVDGNILNFWTIFTLRRVFDLRKGEMETAW
jgi:hypothetical protein